jgi:hypothetical protein
MRRIPWLRPTLFAALLVPALTAPLSAQQTADTQNVELEPISCSWRTSSDAVRVGERFRLVLTCGVIDTAATTVVPDQTRLDPGALQLAPFEVLGGAQAPDLRTPARRFFQYEYDLRYLGEEIGRDLQIPALTMTYRVQSRVQQDGGAVEGRERQYTLPAHAVRILSVVPAAARDIREAAPVTLGEIDARRFRASLLRIGAYTLYAGGTVVAVWGLLLTVRRRSTRPTTAIRHVSNARVLSSVVSELRAVRTERQSSGWSENLAARALTAVRLAASCDLGLDLAQQPARAAATLSGQLRLTGRGLGGDVLVSGSATATQLARAAVVPGTSASRRARLEALAEVSTRLTQAAYGRSGASDTDALDEALSGAERAASAIRREHSWLATRLRAVWHQAGERARARGWQRS